MNAWLMNAVAGRVSGRVEGVVGDLYDLPDKPPKSNYGFRLCLARLHQEAIEILHAMSYNNSYTCIVYAPRTFLITRTSIK